jgi:hypothetical protein
MYESLRISDIGQKLEVSFVIVIFATTNYRIVQKQLAKASRRFRRLPGIQNGIVE